MNKEQIAAEAQAIKQHNADVVTKWHEANKAKQAERDRMIEQSPAAKSLREEGAALDAEYASKIKLIEDRWTDLEAYSSGITKQPDCGGKELEDALLIVRNFYARKQAWQERWDAVVEAADDAGPKLVNVADAAVLCGRNETTIRRWCRQDKLTGADDSTGQWLIPEESLPAKREPEPTPPEQSAKPRRAKVGMRYCNDCGETFPARNGITCPKGHGNTEPLTRKRPAKRR